MQSFTIAKPVKTLVNSIISTVSANKTTQIPSSLKEFTKDAIVASGVNDVCGICDVPIITDITLHDDSEFNPETYESIKYVDLDWISDELIERVSEVQNFLSSNRERFNSECQINITNCGEVGNIVGGLCINHLLELGLISLSLNEVEVRGNLSLSKSLNISMIRFIMVKSDLHHFSVAKTLPFGDVSFRFYNPDESVSLVTKAFKVIDDLREFQNYFTLMPSGMNTSIDERIRNAKILKQREKDDSALLKSICCKLKSSRDYAEISTIINEAKSVGLDVELKKLIK